MPRPRLCCEAGRSWRAVLPVCRQRRGHGRWAADLTGPRPWLDATIPLHQATGPPSRPLSSITSPQEATDSLWPAPPIHSISNGSSRASLPTSSFRALDNDHETVGRKRKSIDEEDQSSLRRKLLDALHGHDVEKLLRVAVQAFRNPDLVKSLPSTTVMQVFDSMPQDKMLRRYKELSSLVTARRIQKAREAGWPVRDISEVLASIDRLYATLFYEWLDAGNPVGLEITKGFLRVCSATGNAMAARALRTVTDARGIEWDTEAYNIFLEAICWEGAYHRVESRSLRVTEQSLSLRAGRKQTLEGFQGYTIQLKNEAIDVFEDMVSKGNAADANTFSSLILAMGRVGDMEGVERTLKRVWGIDVASIMEDNSSELYFENDLAPDSPLCPNSEILFTIAHTFGSNNALATALRLVDYTSQKYSIPVTSRVGEELLRWALILNSNRRGGRTEVAPEKKRELARTLSVGAVPASTFREVWKMLKRPPYSFPHTLQVSDWLLTSLTRVGHIIEMNRTLRILRQTFRIADYNARFRRDRYQPKWNPPHNELESLEALASSGVFTRWVRLMLHINFYRHRGGRRPHDPLSLVMAPNLIGEWGNLWFRNTHRALHYRAIGGSRLCFHRDMEEENTASFELFPSSKAGQFIARPLAPSFKLPFQEKTHGVRRQMRRDRDAERANVQYLPDLQWYELASVGDWIWLAAGRGVLVRGGYFSPETQKYDLRPFALDTLKRADAAEIRQRLSTQMV